MTNKQLTDKSTIGARIAALLVADSVPLSDTWKALIDDAERAELQDHRKGSQALQDVAAERLRQISAEGWSTEHDDEHAPGQLSDAGGCYALNAFEDDKMREGYEPDWWPWERHWYKPGTPRRDLVKAAALIVAEIEHLDRVGSGVDE